MELPSQPAFSFKISFSLAYKVMKFIMRLSYILRLHSFHMPVSSLGRNLSTAYDSQSILKPFGLASVREKGEEGVRREQPSALRVYPLIP